MTVALGDVLAAVRRGDDGALLQHGRVRAETHRATQIGLTGDDLFLIGHRRDDGMLGVGIELLRVRVLETHRAGRLDDHGLQAQAQAEQRDLVGAGETDRAELALDATNTEPARDQDGVDSADSGPGTFLGLALVGRHPRDLDLRTVREATGPQRLGHDR